MPTAAMPRYFRRELSADTPPTPPLHAEAEAEFTPLPPLSAAAALMRCRHDALMMPMRAEAEARAPPPSRRGAMPRRRAAAAMTLSFD